MVDKPESPHCAVPTAHTSHEIWTQCKQLCDIFTVVLHYILVLHYNLANAKTLPYFQVTIATLSCRSPVFNPSKLDPFLYMPQEIFINYTRVVKAMYNYQF